MIGPRRSLPAVLAAALLAALMAAGAGEPPAGQSSKGPSGIVAIVNQDVITWGELDRKVSVKMEETARQLGVDPTTLERERLRFSRLVLNWLLEQRLLVQDAKKNEIPVVEEEVDFRIKEKIEKEFRPAGLNVQDADDLYRILRESYGFSREEYRSEIRDEILVNRLLWTRYFQPEHFITPGEMRAYYRSHPEEFETPSEVTFWMISVDRSAEDQRILRVLDEMLHQKPLEEVAKDLPPGGGVKAFLWTKKMDEVKSWVDPLPEMLSKMKPGEVLGPIQVPSGYRYLKMMSIQPGTRKSFEEAGPEIQKAIRNEHLVRERERVVARLKKEAYIQDYLPKAPLPSAMKKQAPASVEEPPPGKVRDVSPDPVKPKKEKEAEKEASPPEKKE